MWRDESLSLREFHGGVEGVKQDRPLPYLHCIHCDRVVLLSKWQP